MNLTEHRLFALDKLAAGPSSTHPVATAWWEEQGYRPVAGAGEWADRHFRWLRENDLVRLTGDRDERNRRIHEITDLGRKVHAENLPDIEAYRARRQNEFMPDM